MSNLTSHIAPPTSGAQDLFLSDDERLRHAQLSLKGLGAGKMEEQG